MRSVWELSEEDVRALRLRPVGVEFTRFVCTIVCAEAAILRAACVNGLHARSGYLWPKPTGNARKMLRMSQNAGTPK